MPVDTKYLRQHYASLSDEAFQEIDPTDLVADARKCYEEEMRRREVTRPQPQEEREDEPPPPVVEFETDAAGKPTWLENASCVFSAFTYPGQTPADRLAQSRSVLQIAGIPCHEEVVPPDGGGFTEFRLLVPGNLDLQARSVLEKEIDNPEVEEQWRNHLQMLSDDEVLAMPPEVAFGGLIDRIERVTRVYDEEIASRGLQSDTA